MNAEKEREARLMGRLLLKRWLGHQLGETILTPEEEGLIVFWAARSAQNLEIFEHSIEENYMVALYKRFNGEGPHEAIGEIS